MTEASIDNEGWKKLERNDVEEFPFKILLGEGFYGLFPLDWDKDPHIVFHGTNLDNLDSILEHGFERRGPLQLRVSFGKTSGYALYHWCRDRGDAEGVVIVARFKDITHQSLDYSDSSAVYYEPEKGPQPDIVGFMIIPDSTVYAFV